MTSGGVSKELKLELINLGTNITIIIVPLVDGGASIVRV